MEWKAWIRFTASQKPELWECWKNVQCRGGDVVRLISRIRHRQFGVLVTTSAVSRQAYQEVLSDLHPIVFISGGDIVDILLAAGINTKPLVENLLHKEFPVAAIEI